MFTLLPSNNAIDQQYMLRDMSSVECPHTDVCVCLCSMGHPSFMCAVCECATPNPTNHFPQNCAHRPELKLIYTFIMSTIVLQVIHNISRKYHDAIVKCEVHNAVGKSEESEALDISCKYKSLASSW